MIEQFISWRKELRKTAIDIEKRYRQKRWTNSSEFPLEKQLFLGFFIVRKILESKWKNSIISSLKCHVVSYHFSKKLGTMLDPNHCLNNYNIFNGCNEILSVSELCNQFIHSSIFTPFVPFKKEVVGVYICSDWKKSNKIYYIQLVKIIEIFLSFAIDKPIELQLIRSRPIHIKGFKNF